MKKLIAMATAVMSMVLLSACAAQPAAGADGAQQGGFGQFGLLIWVAVFFVIIYFFSIRPQKKEQKKRDAMMNSLAIGDTILTTSGFYGIVIDITEDMVIVEFGNNKNCRIPMQKTAIVQIEKAEEAK